MSLKYITVFGSCQVSGGLLRSAIMALVNRYGIWYLGQNLHRGIGFATRNCCRQLKQGWPELWRAGHLPHCHLNTWDVRKCVTCAGSHGLGMSSGTLMVWTGSCCLR